MRHIFRFFDKLEDNIRGTLSHTPILYALIGGFAIVLFWRGVWMTADYFPFLTGPMSIFLSVVILLMTGLFVSFFVGDVIILSGVTKEKKEIEKTEDELQAEAHVVDTIKRELRTIREEITLLRKEHQNKS